MFSALAGRPRDGRFLPVLASMALRAETTSSWVTLRAFSKGKLFELFIQFPFFTTCFASTNNSIQPSTHSFRENHDQNTVV